MEQTITQQQRRSRAILMGLACVFFGPFLIATIWWNMRDLWPESRTNRGALLDPPVLLSEASLKRVDPGGGELLLPGGLQGKWSMTYVGPAECDELCSDTLHNMRQIWILLNRDMTKVRRLWLTTTAATPEIVAPVMEEQQRLWVADASGRTDLLKQFPVGELNAAETKPERVYLIDPNGYLAFQYLPGQKPKDVLKDLRKLLKHTRVR